ncbi:unnamed protein product, partial [Ectocarpus sp. 12 AP-2014]
QGKGPSTQVNLYEDDIRSLCLVARDVFLDQPCLLQLATPMKICGDIHGQYYDLLRLFDHGGHPPHSNYLFLGDYVDRGKHSLETICLLLCYKVKYPANFFLLRGNHESASINKMYGFYDECKRRYSTKLWRTFTDCFNCLPIAAIVDDKIFCAHGGLSPELFDMEQINRVSRPTDVPDTGLLCDLLWSDPDRDIIGWGENDRGVSFTFGEDIVRDFLASHDLDLICRAHQILQSSEKKRRLPRRSTANRTLLSKGPVAGPRNSPSPPLGEEPLSAPPAQAEEEEEGEEEEGEYGVGESGAFSSPAPETSVPPLSHAAAAAASAATAPRNSLLDASGIIFAAAGAAKLARNVSAPFNSDGSLSSSASDYDSGPPSFGSLPGDHNRAAGGASGGGGTRDGTGSPPTGLGRALVTPTNNFDGSGAATAAGLACSPEIMAGEEGSVVDEGRLGGGSEAGGLERIPVVRLPPPPPTPLSDALATRKLADIDGVGGTARALPGEGAAVEGPSLNKRTSSGRSRGGGGGGSGRSGRGGRQHSSRPPGRELLNRDGEWVNFSTGGGGDRVDKRRRQRWLNTAASRRGDGGFTTAPANEGDAGKATATGPPPSMDTETSGGVRGARIGVATAVARRGLGVAGQAAAAGGGPAVPLPEFGGDGVGGGRGVSGAATMSPGDVGGGARAAGERGVGQQLGVFPAAKALDESDLAVLSSDEDSVYAASSDTYEVTSDTSLDLNVDRRLSGGLGADEDSDGYSSVSDEEDEEDEKEEWGGRRSGGDLERRRMMMAGGDAAATSDIAERRGEQGQANARAREKAAAAATAAYAGGGSRADDVVGGAIDPAILPYVAYGLAAPPAGNGEGESPGVGGSSSRTSSSSSGGGGERSSGSERKSEEYDDGGARRTTRSTREAAPTHRGGGDDDDDDDHDNGNGGITGYSRFDGGGGGGDDASGYVRTRSLTAVASSPEDTIRANRGDSEDFGRRRGREKSMAGRKLGGWRLGKPMTGSRKRGATAAAAAAAAAAAGMGADGGEEEKARGPADLDSSSRSSTYSYSLRSDGGDSLTESEKRSRREGATRLLGSVKKGASVVWSKVTSDHPEPLPIDK